MTRSPSLNLLVHISLLGYERGGRSAGGDPDARTLEYIISRAHLAEEAGFDGVFYGDGPSLNRELIGSYGAFPYEPLTLLSAIASRTSRLGLIATVATQYNDPYNLARRVASLDQISAGRAAWNAVSGFTGERNFGYQQIPSPQERYRRAEEFVDVVTKLWQSWKPGYLLPEPVDGVRYDADRIEDIRHEGEYFQVEGALSVPPSPQQRPLLVQAGASEEALPLAGRFGELVYVAASTFEHAVQQRTALRAAALSYGRPADAIKSVPGLFAYIGATDDEARANRAASLTDRDLLSRGIASVKLEYSGFDFAGIDLDDELRPEDLPTAEEIDASQHRRSRAKLYLEFAQRPGATLRSFLTEVVTGTGHTNLVGSYDAVAQELERWYREGAADGFVLMGTNSLQEFIDEIVPRLESRGVFSASPELTTFRDRLRLPAASITEPAEAALAATA